MGYKFSIGQKVRLAKNELKVGVIQAKTRILDCYEVWFRPTDHSPQGFFRMMRGNDLVALF